MLFPDQPPQLMQPELLRGIGCNALVIIKRVDDTYVIGGRFDNKCSSYFDCSLFLFALRYLNDISTFLKLWIAVKRVKITYDCLI